MKEEIKKFLVIAGVFFFVYYMPLESMHFKGAVIESLYMLQDYARHHVLTCLIPALFIAGAVGQKNGFPTRSPQYPEQFLLFARARFCHFSREFIKEELVLVPQ